MTVVERHARLVKFVLAVGHSGGDLGALVELSLMPGIHPSCTTGSIAYTRKRITSGWISSVMDTIGMPVLMASSGSLLSKPCRVRLDAGTFDEIGHATEDLWFRLAAEPRPQLPARDFVAEALAHINVSRARTGLRSLNTTGWTDDDVLIEARRCGWDGNRR